MENRFKGLWSRKKSISGADRPHQRGLSSNEKSTLPHSAVSDGRPSMASSQQNERSSTQDRSVGSRDLPSINGDEFHRTKSGHRIQPMLVGISRPDTAKDRPDTAGSLQLAVQKAADSVGRPPQEVPISKSATMTVPKGVPTSKAQSRSIDIFSISTSAPSYRSRYNEEVAERNLDNYRLVLENTPYVYDPSSKYQEEVAIRNAYLPYKSRISNEVSRTSSDREGATSMASRSLRSAVSPQPHGAHTHQRSTDTTYSDARPSQDYTTQYSRQSGQHSRDGKPLPGIPSQLQEIESKAPPLQVSTQTPYSPPRATVQSHPHRDARMQTISEGQPYSVRPSTDSSSRAVRDSGYTSGSALPEYQLTIKEQMNRSSSSNDGTLGQSSTRNATLSVKRLIVLPNRTIMDLTNDEGEFVSETSSAAGYSQYSPIVEQARSDAFQKILPSQIHTEERRGSKNTSEPTENIAAHDSTESREFSDSDDSDDSEDAVTPVPDPNITFKSSYVQYYTKPISSSTFSPINTVAAWSPRSSAYITTRVPENISMTARAAAALEAYKASSRESQSPVLSKKGDETPTVRERVATFESNVERDASPPAPVSDTGLNSGGSTAAMVAQTPAKPTAPPSGSNITKTPTSIAGGKMPMTPSIYTSPDSITSVDYINPSNAFGVRTRDFAIMPVESVPLLKEATKEESTEKTKVETKEQNKEPRKAEANVQAKPEAKKPVNGPLKATLTTPARPKSNLSSAGAKKKSTKPRVKVSTPADPIPYDTGFDEEAFKRKQAIARAAMDKLQRSLSEDFLTLPDRAATIAKGSKGKEVDLGSLPVAPSLILPHESKNITVPIPLVQRSESDRPPPSSYRTASRDQQRSSLVSNARSLSASSRSSRRAPAPASLKNVEPATSPVHQNMLSPALLQAIQSSSMPPKSPGEISLSSFPVPSSSRPPSQPDAPAGYHSHSNSYVGAMKRRNSTKSQISIASAFSIPYHMVPGRTSSVRDPVPEEVDSLWA